MKLLAGLFALLLIAIVVAADRGQLPAFVIALYSFPGGDKVGHFLLVGILSLLVGMGVTAGASRNSSRRIVVGGLTLAILVAIEEVSQSLFETRSASWQDLASSYAGILCFSCLAWFIRRGQGA